MKGRRQLTRKDREEAKENGIFRMRSGHHAFFFFYLLYWMAIACIDPYLTLFLESRGLDGVEVGIVLAGFNLAGVFGSVLIGFLVDRSAQIRTIFYLLIAGLLLSVTAMYTIGTSFLILLLTALIYGFSATPNNDIADRLLIDRLGNQAHKYSRYRLGGSIGFGTGVLLAAYLLKRGGLSFLFYAFFIITSVNTLNIRAFFSDHTVHTSARTTPDWKIIFQDGRFYPYLTMIIFGLTETGPISFTSLHLTSVGLDPTLTGAFVGTAMIGEIIGFLILPKVLARFSPWKTITLGFLFQAFRLFAFTLTGKIPLYAILFFQIIGGSSFAFVYAAITQLVSRKFSDGMKTIAHSLKTVANKGIGAGSGSIFIGWMYKYRTTTDAFYLLAALSFLCFIILTILFRRRRIVKEGGLR
jgi:PPP family 3-phenylpropionic acid transporter